MQSVGKDKQAYLKTAEAVMEELQTSSKGLSIAEAKTRLAAHGPNALDDIQGDPSWRKYLRQYKDLMIGLLSASAGLSLYLGDARTAIVLAMIVLFNTTIGFMQEFKAEQIMQALEKLVKPTAEVYRDGNLEEMDSSQLVLGDVVRITEGDSVPADLRIIEEMELSTNDFALTGESNPSRKFTHAIQSEVGVGSRQNLVFMGTTVATGEARGVVIGTGMNTELGRIANLSQSAARELSPLQRELNHIAGRVTIGVGLLCIVLLPIVIQADLGLKGAFLFAIGFASSLIPQGLPAEVNTALAQAARKLAKAKALVKTLSAVESLGATHIICTDKTGTLTKNQMTVEQVLIGGKSYDVSGTGYEANGYVLSTHGHKLADTDLHRQQQFYLCGALASNAKVLPPDDEHAAWYCLGDPTEGALVTLARKAGIDIDAVEKSHPELKEFTFDSARKRMTSVRQFENNLYAYVKGAPESILERCTHIMDTKGKTRVLTDKDRKAFLAQHEELSSKAMRNLAFAYKTLPPKTKVESLHMDTVEAGLTLLGMVSMIDPLREEVPSAMAAAAKAHIRVNVITGDFALTAEAIARKAGLVGKGDHLVTVPGVDLPTMSDADILEHVRKGGTIFSRVSPEDKLRIVNITKEAGEIIAVTGDGINDAPALKRADIGVAMGITGTDVSKQASEIVLLDDSFGTLVGAVQAGRTIFANIRKGTLSCFTSNLSELTTNLASLAAASIFHIPLAITVMQILAIDLIAELFPIAALGWDKSEGELMSEKPRDPKEHILNRQSIQDLAFCGLVIGGLAFANYLLYFQRSGVSATSLFGDLVNPIYMRATTMTYLTIVCCQLINITQRRSIHGFFSRYQFSNPHYWAAIALSLFCVANIVYNPLINGYFGSAAISGVDWLYVLLAGGIFLAIREAQRILKPHTPVTQ
ncbi:cation-transporting P-type ATPase [Candidatus Saccharibacteria bacterium]|nr:cation-transporting P-type ATPase [Candidatus Saccharibacteria bacterium]